jgi:hypothetical protein
MTGNVDCPIKSGNDKKTGGLMGLIREGRWVETHPTAQIDGLKNREGEDHFRQHKN